MCRLASFHLFGFSVIALTFGSLALIKTVFRGTRAHLNGCAWPSVLTIRRIEEDECLLRKAVRWIKLIKRAKRVKRRYLLSTGEGEWSGEREEEREGVEEEEWDGERERKREREEGRERKDGARIDAVQRWIQALQGQW